MPEGLLHRMIKGGADYWLLLVIAFLLAACGGDATETTATASFDTTTPTVTATAEDPSTTAAGTTPQPEDLEAVVGEVIAASLENYRFSSIIEVGDQALTTIEGLVDGDSLAATITTGTSRVDYLRSPEGEWVRAEGGDWEGLEGEPPVGAPLVALTDVGQLELLSGSPGDGLVTAVLGSSAGTAAGLTVEITVFDGLISEIRYETQIGDESAQVSTSFTDVGTAGPVPSLDEF